MLLIINKILFVLMFTLNVPIVMIPLYSLLVSRVYSVFIDDVKT